MQQKIKLEGNIRKNLANLIKHEAEINHSKYYSKDIITSIDFEKYTAGSLLEKVIERFSNYNYKNNSAEHTINLIQNHDTFILSGFTSMFLTYIFSENFPELEEKNNLTYKKNKLNIKTIESGTLENLSIPQLSGKVLLKPNLVSVFPYPETSDYNTIPAVLKKIRENKGISKLYIADGPSLFFDSRLVFENPELKKIAEANSAELVDLNNSKFFKYTFNKEDGRENEENNIPFEIYLPELLFEIDYVVSLSNLKEHDQAGFSGAMKNHIGMIAPFQRLKLHRDKNLKNAVPEIYNAIGANFNVMDARKIMINAQQRLYSGKEAEGFGFLHGSNAKEIDSIAYNSLMQKIAFSR